MAASTAWTFVPLIGLNNLLTADDGGTERFLVKDAAGDFITKDAVGDGGTPSAISTDPQGRPGNAKFVMQLLVKEDLTIGVATPPLVFGLSLPSGLLGAPPATFSNADLQDDNNWPVMDASKLTPICLATSCYSFMDSGYAASPGPTDPFSLPAATTECWPPDITMTLGVNTYIPANTVEAVGAGLFNTPGPYGVMLFDLCLYAASDVTLEGGHAIQAIVDWSHSVQN